ncbi:MAG: LapA family protein [Arthrobacter sp.]|uniref:LapA family protein n=1 Tax=unclassified Arthrobacter TaxID=235627 RepID=UPI00264B27DC|nr:lipopolysaccharide assembly protein LapA domain-containing protein [Micrococcaceae bacterium]MDN5905219.1 lipopolysaccharide assembly protein LapA domain-containing protein [Micrococcaceae bacterium]MDN6200889.1 lipopolysaccharide assembly protein LapA domain-containing protein [Micrococcaceae bacterium]
MAKDPQDRPKPAKTPREPAPGTPSGGAPAGGTPEHRPGTSDGAGRPEDPMRVTRSGVMWTATVLALVFLVLLIIFIAQNTNTVQLRYFGWEGTVQLGLALFVGAVGGGIIVAIAGAARIVQLRSHARKGRVKPGKPGKKSTQ